MGYTLDDRNLLREPAGKNTLPAITWAMARIKASGDPATAVIFPSDHLLDDDAISPIVNAEPLAADYLVTFGVTPTSAHTGYGYIKPGRRLAMGSIADAFVEKPDQTTAEDYVKAGYLWNSGIFLLSDHSRGLCKSRVSLEQRHIPPFDHGVF